MCTAGGDSVPESPRISQKLVMSRREERQLQLASTGVLLEAVVRRAFWKPDYVCTETQLQLLRDITAVPEWAEK